MKKLLSLMHFHMPIMWRKCKVTNSNENSCRQQWMKVCRSLGKHTFFKITNCFQIIKNRHNTNHTTGECKLERNLLKCICLWKKNGQQAAWLEIRVWHSNTESSDIKYTGSRISIVLLPTLRNTNAVVPITELRPAVRHKEN